MMPMKRAGFTLIELLMGMAGAAIILTAIYGVFTRAVKLRDQATERTREVRVRAHATAVLRNDLRNARISGGAFAATLEGSAAGKSGNFPGYLKFITTTARDETREAQDVPRSDLQRVEYYVVTDPAAAGRQSGLLVHTRQLDLLETVQETPSEEPLLAGVAAMEVSFYDGSAWQESWDYAQTQTIPEGVRVRLQLAAADGEKTAPAPIEVLVPWTTQPLP